ncbi:MAG: response regulator transcription factor [Bacteroidetes bacterium]|nr:response regulator transcription factor [Bacteroidota bacterium]
MKIIYIVEDNEVILDGIKTYLELSGFAVRPFLNRSTAMEGLRSSEPDLLILDVMLPDGDGFTFARTIRKKHQFPIIFLTARDSESDRILGFELGADDYIVKPFSPKELVMRVNAILRRVNDPGQTSKHPLQWKWGGSKLLFDNNRHELSVDNVPIYLTAAEWKILEYLLLNQEIVISREQILEHCLDYSFEVSDRIIDTHIKNIRAKLGNPGWIKTIRGYGYIFCAECIGDHV